MKLKFCQLHTHTHVISPIVILSLIDNLRLELVSLNLKINFPHSTNTPFPILQYYTKLHSFSFCNCLVFLQAFGVSIFQLFHSFNSHTHTTLPTLFTKTPKKLQNFKNPQKVPHSFKTPPKNVFHDVSLSN